jgi:hypothetical protein
MQLEVDFGDALGEIANRQRFHFMTSGKVICEGAAGKIMIF